MNNPFVPFNGLKNIKINPIIFLNYSWWIVMLDFRKDVEFCLIWQPVICVTNCPKHYIVHIAFFFFFHFFYLRLEKQFFWHQSDSQDWTNITYTFTFSDTYQEALVGKCGQKCHIFGHFDCKMSASSNFVMLNFLIDEC